MVPLRPYQAAGIEALRSHVRAGRSRVLLQLPTGGGKTVVAAAIIASARQNFGARVLFFAHRLELVNQTVRQLARWGVNDVGVMRGDDERTNPEAPVQVATVQTLARRKLPEADIVFIDEAHRAAGATYKRVIEAYPDATIVGLSATPCRLDGKPLGDIFQAIELGGTYRDLIGDGFIVEPIVYSTRTQPDLANVRTRMGDYAEEDIEAAMMTPHVIGNIVGEWQVHAEGRRTVAYAVTVAHSQAIVERFVEAGITAEHLDGTTPEAERAAILARVESGETLVVSNCAVLTEGWDCPPVKAVIMARPTKSLSLYMQCVGRALRPWNDVTPIVLDHGGNVERHGLPTIDRTWSLLDTPQADKGKSEYHVCKGCYAHVRKNPCELCGYLAPVVPREIREEPGKLEVVNTSADEKRLFFVNQLERARSRGFKPGFASAQWKEKYGAWPPWSWSKEAKSAFADDDDWQRRHTERENEKAHWAAIEARHAAFVEPALSPSPASPLPPEGDSFGDWFDSL